MSLVVDSGMGLAQLSAYELRNGFPRQPVRCHHLKEVGRSPAHARLLLSGVEDEPTAEMSLGTTAHAIIQGRKDILVYRGAVRRGKEWEKFRAEYPTSIIVLDKEMKAAESIANALLKNRDAAALIKARGVKREKTVFFDYLGRECRSTADLMAADGSWTGEIKTTKCADPERFKWDALRLGYHVQKAMQRQSLVATKKKAPSDQYIIAAENRAPWPVSVMRVDDESLEMGARQMRLWMERLIACETSGSWPEYVETIVALKIAEAPLELRYGDEGEEASPP